MEAERLLLILLAIGFLVLLVLCIVLVTSLILVVRSLRRLSLKAEDASENLSATLRLVAKRFVPVAVSTLVAAAVNKARRKS